MRLVYVAFGWAAGIFLAATLITLPVLAWVLLSLMMAVSVGLTWHAPTYRLLNIVLLAFALGGLRQSFVPTSSEIAAYNNTGGLTIEGVVVADPDVRDDRTDLRVSVERVVRGGEIIPSSGLVLVRAPRVVDVRYGDRVAATGYLITPAEFDTFSFADYLGRGGVFSVMQNTAVRVDSGGHASPILAWLYTARRDAQQAIARHLPEPQAGLLTGILTGYERGISPQLNEQFNAVGATHIIAISGFNMVIIAGVVMGALERAQVRGWPAVITGILVITIYTMFAGANAAVIRAAVMSSLLFIGGALRRKTYVPASLAFVALVMSAFNPGVLRDISFQLSFFATLGLALYVEPMQRQLDTLLARLFPRPVAVTTAGFLSEPLIVTLASLVFTLPLAVVYFGRLSPLVIPVNVLIVPVQAYLLILGGLATLLAFAVPLLAQVLYWLDMVLLSWSIGVVRAFAALPFSDASFYIDPRLVYGYFFVLIGWSLMHATQPRWWRRLVRFVRNQAVFSAVIFSGTAIIMLLIGVAFSRPDGQLHVWFLDVGHSNAVLMQTPGGAHVLVDGGRFPSRLLTSIGDRLPFNDREIEALVITQPDEFEFGALPAVLSRYDVGVVLINGQPNLSTAYAELEMALAAYDVLVVTAGYTLDFSDGTRLEVLHPQETPTLEERRNDHAVTLRVSYGDVSFLLTSDLSREGQEAILQAGKWPLATVLQLPQHGTARSLNVEFLEAAQPQVAIVQSDRTNRRGDPDPDVLALLPEAIPVLRTDEGGIIHLWTDGVRLWTQQERE